MLITMSFYHFLIRNQRFKPFYIVSRETFFGFTNFLQDNVSRETILINILWVEFYVNECFT